MNESLRSKLPCSLAIIISFFCNPANSEEVKLADTRLELEQARVILSELKSHKEKLATYQKLETQLQETRKKEVGLESTVQLIQSQLKETEEKKQRQIVLDARLKAVGENLGKLELLSGRIYDDVSIREVNDVGILIRHSAGSGRVLAKDLPKPLQDRFQFDQKEAVAQLEADRRNMAEHESAMTGAANLIPAESVPPSDQEIAPAANVTKPEVPNAAPKGRLTARINSFQTGRKEVEFTSLANCDARVTVYGAVNYPPHYTYSYDISKNKSDIRLVWVRNDYHAEMKSNDGQELDKEMSREKTGLGDTKLGR